MHAQIATLDVGLPARFEPRPDGTLALEATLAERKTLLSRQKLVYRARVRVDDERREVRFWELLKETGAGLVGGFDLIKAEVTGVRGKERSGTLEERSRYFGKRYDYRFDYAAVRRAVEEAAREAGYAFELVLLERSLDGEQN